MKVVLKNYFGYDEFRPLQEDVVKSVLAGKDVMAAAQPGTGKTASWHSNQLTGISRFLDEIDSRPRIRIECRFKVVSD